MTAKKRRVLVVDDVPMNRVLLREILAEEYEVLEAQNGAEACQMLEQEGESIELMLLDVIMPGMDGFEVLTWMERSGWVSRVPVVVISSETAPAFIGKSFSYGVIDYIIRPFVPELVRRRVRGALALWASRDGETEAVLEQEGMLSRQSQELLDRERSKFQFFVSVSREILFDYNVERDTVTFSGRCQEELGLPTVLQDYRKRFSYQWEQNGGIYLDLWKKIQTMTPEAPELQEQVLVKTADGSMQWYELRLRALWATPEDGHFLAGVVGKLENIHQRVQERAKLQERARRDPLTGLYNTAAARDLVEQALDRRSGELSVLMLIDLDHFKSTNDNMGHQFGNDILRQVAQAIRANIRKGDVGARVGGDEFLIYLEDAGTREDVERQCARLVQELATEGERFRCTVCVGAAMCPEHGDTYDQLFYHADQALYSAKNGGRDRYTLYCSDCADSLAGVSQVEELGPLLSGVDENGRETEHEFLIRALDVGVSKIRMDERFTVEWANDHFFQMLGYSQQEFFEIFQNKAAALFLHYPEELTALRSHIRQAFSTGEHYEYICRLRHRSGRKLWLKLTGTQLDEYAEGCRLCYTVVQDVTDREQNQLEQAVTYNNFPGLISKFRVRQDGFYYVDATKRYFEVFRRERRYLLQEMTPESGLGPIAENYNRFRRGEPVAFPIFQDDIHGRRVYMNVNAECVDWIDGDPVYLLLHADVTRLTEQNAQLEQLAFTDLLTGGLNRARFEMEAAARIHAAPAGTYALAWVNMQKFKLINDLAGNEQGDATIRYVHRKLLAHLEDGELVARTSADNYSLLLKNGRDEELAARLNEMIQDVNSFNQGAEYPYLLLFSAGICRVDEELELTQMQDRAHLACKSAGKMEEGCLCACRFYSDKDRQQMQREKNIENRMATALQNREFVVFLQPKLSLSHHAVEGAEALVRWQVPGEDCMQPGSFIPIFERNGFIVRLDLYVMEEVCRLLRRWMDQGRQVYTVSVNVSRAHFANPQFVEGYAAVCRKYDVSPSLIELEVTETIALEDPKLFKAVVAEMHACGFSCSMDDFGSGYSSLNMLKDLQVDTLKLDRAFFRSERMDSDREREVVAAVVDLARKLQMRTVAEGVETETQRQFLEGTSCDMIQGFVFARPLPVEEYERLMFDGKTEGVDCP